MIPIFDSDGRLPPGIHPAEWHEFTSLYGITAYRRSIITGLKMGLDALKHARCDIAYIDGSFITARKIPGDFDACWSSHGIVVELLDPIFFEFANERAAQKARFFGEFFPAEWTEGISGLTFLDFFQRDKETGEPKGIIALDLRRLP